jgi:hypothetical protein
MCARRLTDAQRARLAAMTKGGKRISNFRRSVDIFRLPRLQHGLFGTRFAEGRVGLRQLPAPHQLDGVQQGPRGIAGLLLESMVVASSAS